MSDIKLEAKKTYDLFARLNKAGISLEEVYRTAQVIKWVAAQRGLSNWTPVAVKAASLKEVVSSLEQLEALHAGVVSYKETKQKLANIKSGNRSTARGLSTLIKAGQKVELSAFSADIQEMVAEMLTNNEA